MFGSLQVDPLMPDRPKVRDQTKRDKGFTSGTRLFNRHDCESEPETA